ncbi:MAG: hypothetical protein ABSH44_05430 [Bryobacteraceae bacterium]|jgi:hypothetical protein
MRKNFVIAFGIGVVCVAIAVWWVVYMQRGAHIDLPGKVLKVRTAPLDEASAVAVVDFRVSNPADYPFVVRTVTVAMEDGSGAESVGQTISEVDARQVFQAIPLLGQKYNDTLLMRDTIPPHNSWDRMVAARFEAPDAKLQARKRFVVRVEEVDGKVFELSEK